jgi:hypothetical protein
MNILMHLIKSLLNVYHTFFVCAAEMIIYIGAK